MITAAAMDKLLTEPELRERGVSSLRRAISCRSRCRVARSLSSGATGGRL